MTSLLDDLIPTPMADQTPCMEHSDPEIWFPATAETAKYATSLCGTCPISAACLEGALARQEGWGVWGGQLFEHGQVVRQKRGRGRPRKHQAASSTAA